MNVKRIVFVVKGRSLKRLKKATDLVLTIDEGHPAYWLTAKAKSTFLFF